MNFISQSQPRERDDIPPANPEPIGLAIEYASIISRLGAVADAAEALHRERTAGNAALFADAVGGLRAAAEHYAKAFDRAEAIRINREH